MPDSAPGTIPQAPRRTSSASDGSPALTQIDKMRRRAEAHSVVASRLGEAARGRTIAAARRFSDSDLDNDEQYRLRMDLHRNCRAGVPASIKMLMKALAGW